MYNEEKKDDYSKIDMKFQLDLSDQVLNPGNALFSCPTIKRVQAHDDIEYLRTQITEFASSQGIR